MSDMNYIEFRHKQLGVMSVYVYYLSDAKKFAKMQWALGIYDSIVVVNKKDQDALILGERP